MTRARILALLLLFVSGCTFKSGDLDCAACPVGRLDPTCYGSGSEEPKPPAKIEEETIVRERRVPKSQ